MIYPSQKFLDVFKSTPGALSVTEAIAIINLAAQAPEGNYLEMGTHKGKSAQAALYSLKGNHKFFLLEPEFNNQDFLDVCITGVNKVCVIANTHVTPVFVPEYSTDFIPKFDKYAYVFSDSGTHDNGLPLEEVKMLEDKIVSGGLIVFHDFKNQFREPAEAAEYLVSTGKYDWVDIDWRTIIDYVSSNNLEQGNDSWHLYDDRPYPNFVGAVRRKQFMPKEYLNIDYHIKRLILIAMAKYKTKKEQAKALGIHTRTLADYKWRYKLTKKVEK